MGDINYHSYQRTRKEASQIKYESHGIECDIYFQSFLELNFILQVWLCRCQTQTSSCNASLTLGKYHMVTSSNGNIFRVTGPLCVEFPAQRPVTRSVDVFLRSARLNGWVNNGEAGDLRRHRAHYAVTVMTLACCIDFYVHVYVLWVCGRTCPVAHEAHNFK